MIEHVPVVFLGSVQGYAKKQRSSTNPDRGMFQNQVKQFVAVLVAYDVYTNFPVPLACCPFLTFPVDVNLSPKPPDHSIQSCDRASPGGATPISVSQSNDCITRHTRTGAF